MVKGISHITLSVSNLEKSFEFYKNSLGFKPLLKGKISAYFLAGDLWFCIEQDAKTRSGALPEYTHIAFSVEPALFKSLARQIRDAGVQVFKENKSEGDSLYFLDPDGHKLEIHVGDWRSRIEHYRENKADEFEFF